MQETAKRGRADILAADQAEPVDALGIAQLHGAGRFIPVRHRRQPFWPIRLSVPVRSLAMFVRCFTNRSTASTVNRIALSYWPSPSRASGAATLAVSAESEE